MILAIILIQLAVVMQDVLLAFVKVQVKQLHIKVVVIQEVLILREMLLILIMWLMKWDINTVVTML